MNAWQLHPQLADDTTPVIELPLCEVRLMDDANHPWLVLVPRVAGITEIIDLDPAQRSHMMEITGRRTVPQIFIGDTHVGGHDDLVALDQRGGLDPLLAGA